MSDEITTVEATGKDSSSRVTAKHNALEKLVRELNRQRMIDVGDASWKVHVARPGRFYAVATVKARPRR